MLNNLSVVILIAKLKREERVEEATPQTIKEFVVQVHQSAASGSSRDSLEDSKRLLNILGIKWEVKGSQVASLSGKKWNKKPTIIVANHFWRRIYERKTFLSTLESFITTAIISLALSKFTYKKTVWVVKEINPRWLFIPNRLRSTQMVFAKAYGLLLAKSNYPIGNNNLCLATLDSGKSLALYIEGKGSRKLKPPSPNFANLLKFLDTKPVSYQILPVSIWHEEGKYKVSFGKIVQPGKDANQTLPVIMHQIALGLPKHLRGKYTKDNNHAKRRVLY